MTMTPPHLDSPLRRSEVGAFRTPVQTPVINDDEAERREARSQRDSMFSTPSINVENSETLKNCLQICQDNKLSKDNAWAVSVIDTLSSLMSRHHKSLNNFKVAGSSLEASSKVYALRVDSVHSEVVRMSSGLNKQKVISENDDDDGEQQTQDGQQEGNANTNSESAPKRKKKVRKSVSTITKNKETINGRLDTNPFTDPIFAKLNSTTGNISGSNRLLQNVLHSVDSELRLRMDYPFWDSETLESLTHAEEHDYTDMKLVDAEAFSIVKLDGALLRPHFSGYIITDTPAEQDDDEPVNESAIHGATNESNSQMVHAFDMNAEIEATQPDNHFIDMDVGEYEELTVEEQVAINNCKGLRRAPVLIEDMRPLDSTSVTLEYSYRPLDKISQFWAGPSHWKFKKPRNKSLSMAQRFSSQTTGDNAKKSQNLRGKRKIPKHRTQQLEFLEVNDNLFQILDEKSKARKGSLQKKWDMKKFKLPTDLQIDKNVHDVFHYAPGLPVLEEVQESILPDLPESSAYDYNDPVDKEYCTNIPNDDTDTELDHDMPDTQENADAMNQTVMEIATNFVGAPDKVIKVIVPFAKRAKVIDMKQLKKSCMLLIDQQVMETNKENYQQPYGLEGEHYKSGIASFKKIYTNLPRLLTPSMNEALSPSIAFYSILHLANESNLRLVADQHLKDFQIRKIDD